MTIEYKDSIEEIFINGGYRVKNNIDQTSIDLTNSFNPYQNGGKEFINRFVDLVVPIGLICNKTYNFKEKISETVSDKIINEDIFDKLFYSLSLKRNTSNRVTKKNRK